MLDDSSVLAKLFFVAMCDDPGSVSKLFHLCDVFRYMIDMPIFQSPFPKFPPSLAGNQSVSIIPRAPDIPGLYVGLLGFCISDPTINLGGDGFCSELVEVGFDLRQDVRRKIRC